MARSKQKKVIIVGAGLAGLSTGIHLLEKRKDLDVKIHTLGHHLGGRASTWRDPDNYNIVHGFHAIMASYTNMRSLMKRASINEKEALVSNKGINLFYEQETGSLHQFNKPFQLHKIKQQGVRMGYSSKVDRQLARFYLKNIRYISGQTEIEHFDDICYTRWALDHGMPPELTKKRFFRFHQDAYFNWPSKVSAYITLKSFQLTQKSNVFYINGSLGERIIAPLVSHFLSLGGQISIGEKLVELKLADHEVNGLVFANPIFHPDVHQHKWPREIPIHAGEEKVVQDFDAAVIAIPLDCFKELNKGDASFWTPSLSKIHNISSVATLSWQVWTKEPTLPRFPCAINGLDEPMGTVIDYKHLVDEYRNDDRLGSVLEWVGQETKYEDYSDEELKKTIIESFLKIPGARNPYDAVVLKDEFRRNTSNYERYPLTEPGVNKFRPNIKTPYRNLFLAGDWIRNTVDIPTMEGAVTCGKEAADQLLKSF